MIILAFGNLKNPSLLKFVKRSIFFTMGAYPVLIVGKILRCTKNPLVVSGKQPFFQELLLLIKKSKRKLFGIRLIPIKNESCSYHRKRFCIQSIYYNAVLFVHRC